MRWMTGVALAAVAAGAGAQSVEQLPAWDINMDRVHITSANKCKAATYIVPTTYLYTSFRTKVSSWSGHVSSKANVYTTGWDKAYLQSIARTMQDDLIAKLRATGATVLTYDDIRGDLAGASLREPNRDLGISTHSDRFHPGLTFVVATPTDQQAIAAGGVVGPLLGAAQPFAAAARRLNATVLVPSLLINAPYMEPQKDGSLYRTEVSIKYSPHVTLNGLAVVGVNATGTGSCFFGADPMGWRPASVAAGHLEQSRDTSFTMEGVAQSRGDYVFTLDRDEFRRGVLRIDQTVNNVVVAAINKR